MFALAPDCHAAGRYQRVWQRHFYEGLVGAVPKVIVPKGVDFQWARPAARAAQRASAERTATSERLWDQIHGEHEGRGLDAVISYCFSADVDVGMVTRVTELGVPWINFFCDSTYAFDLVERLAGVASLNWFPEHAAQSDYAALGRPSVCRPYAVNPAALPEASVQTVQYRVGFVGAPTGNRVLRLAGLLLRGVRPTIRGAGWRRAERTTTPAPPASSGDRRLYGSSLERALVRGLVPVIRGDARPLSDDEMAPFLAACAVVLGLNEGRDLQGAYRSYMKLRDVEFPGYGSCYLTQHNEDLEAAFEVGAEVLTFHDMGEAAALVRRYARRPEQARAIGQAARRRVLASHTWTARVAELARAL